MSWDPARYLDYATPRLRPALDLLARIDLDAPREIVDLGCGAGNVSRRLIARWPQARLTGVDADARMLAEARRSTAGDTRFDWVCADLARWKPKINPNVIYSNAAMHWVRDHRHVLPGLFRAVAPGGVMAVQMPDNFAAPSHAALFDVVTRARYAAAARAVNRRPVHGAGDYFEWLSPDATALDIWITEYLHRLDRRDDGEHPVVAWMQGAALTPVLAALADDADGRAGFLDDYRQAINASYPLRPDGSVLLPFRRLFIVARRA